MATSTTVSAADMEYYYHNCYPFGPVFSWLNRSTNNDVHENTIKTREFAMAFRSGAYKRYNSISTLPEFKDMICKFNPDRFEIGAIYNKPPKDRDILMKSDLIPLSKELVFDIDMDDYDPFRTCCQGAQVCNKCWKFITLSIHIINTTLQQDFGFHNMIWIFSGRRGAHCWCNDTRAMQLTDSQRRNILDYLNVIKDRSLSKRPNLKRPYHPLLLRSLQWLKPHFTDFILIEQDPWRNDQNAINTLLPNLGEKLLIDELTHYWTKQKPNRSSIDKWNDIDEIASNLPNITTQQRRKDLMQKLKQWKEDIVLLVLYPKLDIEVTRQLIHLLKAPFCVHPSTGKICVPIDPSIFTPEMAPTLLTIQNEFSSASSSPTSLQPFINYFNDKITQFNNTKKRPLD